MALTTPPRGRSRKTIALDLVAAGCILSAATAEAASEVVAGVIACTSAAPRTATFNGTSGIIEGDLVCSSRPADGDCTEQIRRDLDDRGCAFRRDETAEDDRLHFVCSGPRQDMIELIDLVCRRLNGF